jgi:ferrous-iron efflux pump FieF
MQQRQNDCCQLIFVARAKLYLSGATLPEVTESINHKTAGRSNIAATGLISGGAAVILALFIAVTTNSLALWADWVATLLDFLAVFIAWWGLRKSDAGKTDTYHFGFGRFESLTSMGMAVLMVVSFLCIAAAASYRFLHPVAVEGMGVLIGMVLHVIFGFINVRLMLKSLWLERNNKTALVTAQRRVFTIKAGGNILMFATLCISFFFRRQSWAFYADPIAAVLIACLLLAGAARTFKFSVRDLLDCAVEEQSQLLIMRALALHFDRYEQIHDIRTRCAGSKVYIEIFLEFSPERPHGTVMETIHSLQHEIKKLINCDEVLIIPV